MSRKAYAVVSSFTHEIKYFTSEDAADRFVENQPNPYNWFRDEERDIV